MCVCVCGGRGEGLAVRKTLVIGFLGQCTVLWASNWGIPHMAVPSLRITYMKYGSIFFLINSVSRNFCPRSIISPFITSLYDIATQLQPSRIKWTINYLSGPEVILLRSRKYFGVISVLVIDFLGDILLNICSNCRRFFDRNYSVFLS